MGCFGAMQWITFGSNPSQAAQHGINSLGVLEVNAQALVQGYAVQNVDAVILDVGRILGGVSPCRQQTRMLQTQ